MRDLDHKESFRDEKEIEVYKTSWAGIVVSGKWVLILFSGKEFPETYEGGSDSVAKFTGDGKLRGSPPDFSMSHLCPSHRGKGPILSSVGPV